MKTLLQCNDFFSQPVPIAANTNYLAISMSARDTQL